MSAPDMSDWKPDPDGQYRVDMDGVRAIVRLIQTQPPLWSWQVHGLGPHLTSTKVQPVFYAANGTAKNEDTAKAAALAVLNAAVYANGCA